MKRFQAVLPMTALILAVTTSTFADALSGLSNDLQLRANALNGITLNWNVDQKVQQAAALPQDLSETLQQAEDEATARAKKEGITDQSKIKQMVDRDVHLWGQVLDDYTVNTDSTWMTASQGAMTLVSGEDQFSPAVSGYYRCYFGPGYAMTINVRSEDMETHELAVPTSPQVWGYDDNGIYYRNPTAAEPHVTPELITLLMGTNPLLMYGTSWKIISMTAHRYVLQSRITSGGFNPFTLTMQLDRDHGNASCDVSCMPESGRPWHEVYHVNDYRQENGYWISSDVTTDFSDGYGVTLGRRWRLTAVHPTQQLTVVLPANAPITDYRLLGNAVATGRYLRTIEIPTNPDNKNIVGYDWQGHLPSLDELKKLREMEHPGEATPDPTSTTSMLPTVGGLACLALGVLTYRRRGKGDA